MQTLISYRSLPTMQSKAQEDLYVFPYHHIPHWGQGEFQHFRALTPSYEYAAYLRHLVQRANSMTVDSVLDLGCGDGRLCAELRAALPSTKITGIDVSARAISFARAFVPDCEFLCGDVVENDIDAGPFDLIYSVEVLEHIEPAKVPLFLDSMRRLLAPGGRLLLTVPSSNVALTDKHFQHFSPSSLEQSLTPYFCVNEIIPLNRRIFWEGLLYRLLGNRWFILSNPRILNALFRFYEKRCLFASHRDCGRLLAICTQR